MYYQGYTAAQQALGQGRYGHPPGPPPHGMPPAHPPAARASGTLTGEEVKLFVGGLPYDCAEEEVRLR